MILTSWTSEAVIDPYIMGEVVDVSGSHVDAAGPEAPGQGFVDDLFPVSRSHAGICQRAEVLADFLLGHGVSLNLDKTFYVCLNPVEGKPPPGSVLRRGIVLRR